MLINQILRPFCTQLMLRIMCNNITLKFEHIVMSHQLIFEWVVKRGFGTANDNNKQTPITKYIEITNGNCNTALRLSQSYKTHSKTLALTDTYCRQG